MACGLPLLRNEIYFKMNNKILVVGPAWVGDMMMAHVLFQLLRQQNPNVEIHVLAPAWCEALLSRMPEVTKKMISPFGHGELKIRERYLFAQSSKKENYDQAIVMPNSFKSALIPFFARIPVRTGWVGECRFGLLNDIRFLNKKAYPKMIDRFAALAFSEEQRREKLPNPILTIDYKNREAVLKHYQIIKSEKPILALCPGAEYGPSKRWPPEYFATVALQHLNQGWAVWIVGSHNDIAIAEIIQVKTESRCVNFTGKTSLADAIDLLSLATRVITNDSGLMHIAAALSLDVIAIYGSTSTEYTPPLSDRARIVKLNLPCQPCFKRECPLKHHRCMRDLLPEKIK